MTDPPAIVAGKLIETFRQEGANSRSVGVTLHENGSVGIDLQDMGPLVRQLWGDGDYERWTVVPAAEVPRLAVALLLDKYRGDPDAVDAFAAFCRDHGIPIEQGDWA